MASSTVTVVRWTALITGIIYGITHQSTLQLQFDERKKKHHAEHRADLIEKAKAAWAAKSDTESLIIDPDNPKFDVEKVIAAYAK
ncbi:ATP synthase E chain-domain-containing protein [Kockovaella imperatae]|uniref:ATP synthase F(0) complex subunit e, mitochondrial n=1 Tax=Kockovaella imperatae TaxID=4999 RepID=A0A1Y1UI87_9TREE|nr:ATP synthase E chain-domain-containing protein [Kockovaella imperatae]ORX37770.1 ATP synthase E chain-domain-containing protein [Kockovaella imperatae]